MLSYNKNSLPYYTTLRKKCATTSHIFTYASDAYNGRKKLLSSERLPNYANEIVVCQEMAFILFVDEFAK